MNLSAVRNTALVVILLAFAGACFFTFPSYDDFDYSTLFLNKGYWGFQHYHYFSWGGRYTSNGLISGIIALDPLWELYPFWSLSVLGVTLVSLYVMFRSVARFNGTPVVSPFLICSVVLIAAFPTIVQAFYWITGAMTYTTSIAGGALGITLIVQRERRSSWAIDAALLLLTVLVVGFNEIALIGWMEILATYLVLKFFKSGKIDYPLLAIIFIGTACGLCSLFAPGNFIRQNKFEKSGQVFRTVGNGILHYVLFSIKLLTTAIAVVVLRWRQELAAFSEKVLHGIETKQAMWLVFAHWFLFIFTTTAIAFWAMGRKPNTRSMNVITFYYWLMLPFVVWLLMKLWKRPTPVWLQRSLVVLDRHWVMLFFVAVLGSRNVRNLPADYLFKFAPYRAEMQHRLSTLKQGKGQDITLELIKSKPSTTFYSDLGKQDPINFKTMFGLRSLTFTGSEIIDE